MSSHYQADIAIIGGGIAGIVCALELLNHGLSIIMLDADNEERFGGLARESFGGILIVDTPEQKRAGIHDSAELALRDWLKFGDFGHDEKEEYFPRLWAESYINDSRTEIYDRLKSYGINFLPMPLWVERGLYGEGNSVPRWHVVWGTGQGLIASLTEALQKHQNRNRLRILFNHKVDALQRRGGSVSGCSGTHTSDNKPFDVNADVVIIAAGGINGDLNAVRKHWHPEQQPAPQIILNGSHRFADGTMHHAAAAQGANITHLQNMWNYAAGIHHWKPQRENHGLSIVPPKSALWLNARGERIGPVPLVSGFDTRDLVTQICRQPHGYSWQLMNRTIAVKEMAISGAEFNHSIREKNKIALLKDVLTGNAALVDEMIKNSSDVITAQDYDELAEKMSALSLNGEEVKAHTLRSVVEEYDAQIARGERLFNDEQLRRIAHLRQWRGDKMRTCRFQAIADKKAMPFIAVREFIISRKSLGGIQTDLSSRVLRNDSTAIDGLYAIGEAAGFGGGGCNGLRGLEGTFLGGCIYSAHRAAHSIVFG